MDLKLGKVNGFLYGILITLSIIVMVIYVVWLLDVYLTDKEMTWKQVKDKCTEKWYNLKKKVKGV